MAQIIPIRDLKNTANVSKLCNESNEPIFITKNGYGDMVLMNMELYNQSFAMLDLCKKLKAAEDDPRPAVPAKPVFDDLLKKYE